MSSLPFQFSDSLFSTQAFCRVLAKYNNEVNTLKKPVEQGQCIPNFGTKSDEICNKVCPLAIFHFVIFSQRRFAGDRRIFIRSGYS
jgi:hypothetical protein